MLSQPERPEQFTLLHRGPGGPANQLSKVTTLRGEVEHRGIAARGQRLWMIYSDGTMQSIRAEPTPLKDGWTYQRRRFTGRAVRLGHAHRPHVAR